MRETTSLPRLTAAALSRALNLEQGSRLLTVRLPGVIDCKALRECFSLNSNGVPDICELERIGVLPYGQTRHRKRMYRLDRLLRARLPRFL